MTPALKTYLICAVLFIICLVADQATKWAALSFITDGPIDVLPFFNLVLVYNRGVSFGLLSDANAPLALITMASVMVIGLMIWLIAEKDKWLKFALSIIISGAIGNIIDRARFGAVVDFLDFHAFGWHYPAFNIADSCIVLGIAFLLIDSLFLRPSLKEHQNSEDQNA